MTTVHVYLNDELWSICPSHHVDSIVAQLELDGLDVDVEWQEDDRVQLTVQSEDE